MVRLRAFIHSWCACAPVYIVGAPARWYSWCSCALVYTVGALARLYIVGALVRQYL